MNWQQRINEAEKRFKKNKTPFFTENDITQIQLWTTCPISETNDIKFRNDNHTKGPTDIYLILDSIYLTKAIENDEFQLAQHCYISILNQIIALKDSTDRITNMNQSLGKWTESTSPHILALKNRKK